MAKRLKITFESDWHIGSGAGIPGSIDRMVLRDENGFPYIPGKTLTGILRDSAEFIASVRGRAENAGTEWEAVADSLFGTQAGDETKNVLPAKIGIGNAYFSAALRELLKKNEGLIPFLFMTQPGVKIDRKTGQSLKDHLYTREEARSGCFLYADITGYEKLGDDEKKFLEDILKAARYIGGKRRRGGGKCKIELTEAEDKKQSEHSVTNISANNSLIELEYRLETIKPVIVKRATLGNVVESESFIPGTFLLPFFTRDIPGDTTLARRIRQGVMDGEFSVGQFLPEVDGEIAYPVPLSYSRKKDDKNAVFNRLVSSPTGNTQMKDIRSGYIAPSNGKVKLVSADNCTMLRTHNTVDDKKQRPTSDTGGVFIYQAIKPGLAFRGVVRISDSLWKDIQGNGNGPDSILEALLGEHLVSIGQSRKDEYGLVRITYMSVLKNPECHGGLIDGKYLAVYLMSDVLNRGKNTLSYSASVDNFREALSAALRVALKDAEFVNKNSIGGDRGHCVRAGRRESWHGEWQLPRPSLVFIRGGSVFLFEVENPGELHDTDCVKKWNIQLLSGIGDRIGEGYGRVFLNPSFLCGGYEIENIKTDGEKGTDRHKGVASLQDSNDVLSKLSKNVALSDKGDEEFFSFLLNEYIRETYRKKVRKLVEKEIKQEKLFDNLPWGNGPRPRASQFGTLRELAASTAAVETVEPLRKWLDSIERRNTERQMWSQEWRDWLNRIVSEKSYIWELSEFNEVYKLDEELKSELYIFAVSVFLDILCEAVFDNKEVE